MSGFIWAQICLGALPAVSWRLRSSFPMPGWRASRCPCTGCLVLVGVLSGMEIPLIARVLKEIGAPEFRFENVLSVDYVGALAASVAFPLLIIPQLGLMSASLSFGALNLGGCGPVAVGVPFGGQPRAGRRSGPWSLLPRWRGCGSRNGWFPWLRRICSRMTSSSARQRRTSRSP